MNANRSSELPPCRRVSRRRSSLPRQAGPGDTTDFVSLAPGYWPDVPADQWNDWKWQLKNRVTHAGAA